MTSMDNDAERFFKSLNAVDREAFQDRRMSATLGQIAELAKQMWKDPELGAMFRRLGVHGDMETPCLNEYIEINSEKPWLVEPSIKGTTEWHRTWQFIDRFRRGPNWGLRTNDLWIATGLCRQRADGLLSDFHSAEALAYIKDRRGDVEEGETPYQFKAHSAEVVIEMAKAMLQDERFRQFITSEENLPEKRKMQNTDYNMYNHIIVSFEDFFVHKYCYFNRSFMSVMDIAYAYVRDGDERIDGWEEKYLVRYNSSVKAWLEGRR